MKRLAKSRHQHRHGVALLWTVLVCGLLAVLLIGLITTALSERKVSRGEKQTGRADLLTDSVLQEVLAKLSAGFAEATPQGDGLAPAHVTASPGLLEVRHYRLPYNRGSTTGKAAFAGGEAPAFLRNPFLETYEGQPANPRWIPLFSWKSFAPQLSMLTQSQGQAADPNPDYNPAMAFNINTPQNPFAPGYCYLSGVGGDLAGSRYERSAAGQWASPAERDLFGLQPGETSAERPVWVQWIPVLQNPAEKPSEKNRMVARYAYWVDVENTKLHLEHATRPLREHEVFARFLGESDGAAGGSGGYFEQGSGNPFRALRQHAEGLVPTWDKTSPSRRTLDGLPGPGLSAAVAAEVRDTWLGWRKGQRPAAADTSLVDWDFFAALRPRGTAETMALDQLLSHHAQLVSSGTGQPWRNAGEAYSLLDPKLRKTEGDTVDTRLDLMRQLVTGSATVWGYEEERDPLGRPKIDLPKWQRAMSKGGQVSVQAIRQSELWTRLHDPAYYLAYYPAAFPTGGQAKPFVATWNRFAGNGSPDSNQNGEAAALQMLVNIAEYAQPANTPPLIDPELGLVGARSQPYVAEVATRARSAWWLLPAEARANLSSAFLPDGTSKTGGKSLGYYASHVIVDLALGCVNSNPFETEPFHGEVELDVEWHSPPPDSEVVGGTLKAPLEGRFTTSPESGKEPGRAHVLGHTAYFRLGVVPSSALTDPAFASTFRIQGWRLTRAGQPCHVVPIRQPGGQTPRAWWAMAQAGENAGSPFDARSLAAYQVSPGTNGYRAVGWFTRPSLEMLMPDTLFLTGLSGESPLTADQQKRLATWAQWASKTTLLERVFSVDPPLGHRTGDSSLTGLFGRGHFYGALGHTWRRLPMRESAYIPQKPGQTQPDLRELFLEDYDYGGITSTPLQVPSAWGQGAFLAPGSLATTVPGAVAKAGPKYTGKYFSHFWLYPTEKQELGATAPNSLTALYLLPELEGPLPLGDLDGTRMVDLTVQLDSSTTGRTLHDFDLETSSLQSSDLTVLPEPKKSSRSFYSHAPAGRLMTTLGEIGFCHSGFPNRPILLNPEEGRTDYQLNSPRHGPPMRMLLDLFAPGSFSDPETGEPVSEASWNSAQYTSASLAHPRRGLWSVNTAMASDQYMALREGGPLTDADLEANNDVTRLPAHAVWLPNATGHARRSRGAEKFHGKELDDIYKKDPGHILDRHESPYPALARPWNMWLGVIGGDFSPTRATGGQLWGLNNVLSLYGGPGAFTWSPGRGLGQRTPYYALAMVDLAPASAQRGKLLAFGTDGRSNDMLDAGVGDGALRGRWGADQNLASLGSGRAFYLPAHHVTRLNLFPMRHFLSDLALDYRTDAEFHYIKTPLNPRVSSAPLPPSAPAAAAQEGNGFPGGFHSTGVFYNAPLALLTNQASTSANAFTVHIVTQSIRDVGKLRTGIPHSGYGYCDPEDEVVAERWSRAVIEKIPDTHTIPTAPRFRILQSDTANR